MQLTNAIVVLGLAAFTTVTNAQSVAYGQELQEDDQTNHWVVWTEGEDACPGQQILGVLTESPCEQPFNLGEVEYTFTGCSGDTGEPTVLLDSGGLQIGGCGTTSDKINCHDGLHDIIKHGVCTVVTGAKVKKDFVA